MQYREFGKTGEKVSALGFGCMRLPTLGNLTRSIDEPQAVRMIRNGIGNGINYIDTAFFYHEGRSEGLVGKALENGYRNKVLLATKSPFTGFKLGVEFDRILDTQLKRLNRPYRHVFAARREPQSVEKFGAEIRFAFQNGACPRTGQNPLYRLFIPRQFGRIYDDFKRL